ncbi:uncharacterized protein BO95DRAFT_430579 [Aspergillus brunneoviolaceus CBS 621.78]|uniref:Uncharacterized protein n=1 Tax=Aspergillus brunneoviolaceus CBS 621.78 TaxID=1450534 RepID=A0ACD1GDJ1_9EURO|nr:hypothetical protein BO95DRAFT_430579 [Aspergillus brunneoviolaceus CBS 621.78]RAH47292.1 hypothetical protein BO95DRAFT_430579 [Aspergillus brunneoviolaceus CBS 621.78]
MHCQSGCIHCLLCRGLVCVYTYGAGQSYTDPKEAESKARQYLQARYADPLLHGLTLLLARLSLLLSCRRMFPIPNLRFRVDTFIFLSAVLWFFKTIPQVLICIPPQYFWNRSILGGCSSSQLQFWTFGVFDLVLDAALLFLLVPRYILLRLGGMRVQLTLVLIFGSIGISANADSVIMSGVVRVVYGCETGDFLGDYGHVIQWSVMQLGFAVMCACMPCFLPGLPVNEVNGGDRLVWLVFRLPEQPSVVRMPRRSAHLDHLAPRAKEERVMDNTVESSQVTIDDSVVV